MAHQFLAAIEVRLDWLVETLPHRLLQAQVYEENEWGEVMHRCPTILEVICFLLLFMCCQDLDRVPVALRRRIGVCDPDIEDRRRSAMPKAVGCHVAIVFWQCISALAVAAHLQAKCVSRVQQNSLHPL